MPGPNPHPDQPAIDSPDQFCYVDPYARHKIMVKGAYNMQDLLTLANGNLRGWHLIDFNKPQSHRLNWTETVFH